MASPTTGFSFFDALESHRSDSVAIIDSASDQRIEYAKLIEDVKSAQRNLDRLLGGMNHPIRVVSFLLSGGYDYVGNKQPNPMLKNSLTSLSYNPCDSERGRTCASTATRFPRYRIAIHDR
jgi:hypothetical protein